MDRIVQILVALMALYAIVFLFTLMGSQTFLTRRTIVHNVPGTAAVLTVIFILIAFWAAFWGKYAWPAFFGLIVLLIMAGGLIASIFSKKDDQQK